MPGGFFGKTGSGTPFFFPLRTPLDVTPRVSTFFDIPRPHPLGTSGLDQTHESEWGNAGPNDRSFLELPGAQEQLITRVAAAAKRTIVVMLNGGPIAVENWIGHVDGVLEAFYPGEFGGQAIVDLLFATGGANPSGKLPFTMYRGDFVTRSIFQMDLRKDGVCAVPALPHPGTDLARNRCTGGGKILPGENFAGKLSPLRTVAKFSPGEFFGGTVPSFATAAEGLCFLRRAKRLPTRLSPPFLAQMYGIWCC